MNAETPTRRRGRPPKNAEGFNETRASLIKAGLALLTEKGFSASGLDEILRRVAVPKGSFYHYFSSKEQFGSELIANYDNYFRHKIDRFLTDETLSPLQRIEAFMADAKAGMARYDYTRGCLIGNLGQEMGALPEPFRVQLQNVFIGWQKQFEDCLLAAKAAGEIPETSDCGKLATLFWIGWEGAVLRSKLDRNAIPLDLFGTFFLSAITK